MDNMVALTYLKKMGATRNQKITKIAKKTKKLGTFDLKWDSNYSRISPECLNKLKDQESCRRMDSSVWMLNKNVLQNLFSKLGTPEIDLFTSRVSHQLPKYVAWNPNPYSIATDALSVLWSQKDCYTFHPFYLIPRVLSEILHKQEHSVILITPCWQTQLWYPKILSMLEAMPVFTKNYPRLLINLSGRSTQGD